MDERNLRKNTIIRGTKKNRRVSSVTKHYPSLSSRDQHQCLRTQRNQWQKESRGHLPIPDCSLPSFFVRFCDSILSCSFVLVVCLRRNLTASGWDSSVDIVEGADFRSDNGNDFSVWNAIFVWNDFLAETFCQKFVVGGFGDSSKLLLTRFAHRQISSFSVL